MRNTAFVFTAAPTAVQERALSRHAGAARVAFNRCLDLHLAARNTAKASDNAVPVPWSGFDLINCFNAWKRSEDAGRRFVVAPDGEASVEVTGLAWRTEVSAQVFEEAAVDLGKALKAWTDSRKGKRAGRKVSHPRRKKKGRDKPSFRMRNKTTKTKNGLRSTIRVGEGTPRSVTLPSIGVVKVHDDTRRLRRMLAKGRAKILFATITQRAGKWRISLNVEAADLHPDRQHDDETPGSWVGVDRGLTTPLVAATSNGRQTLRIETAPKALRVATPKTRRLQKSVSRKQKGSTNRRRAVARLARHHRQVRNQRHHWLHQVSNQLVNTHDQLVLEDLNVAGMLSNHHLAKSISDAAWSELARMIGYKQQWRNGRLVLADRWFASSQTCSSCGRLDPELELKHRTYTCGCGLVIDRDLNLPSTSPPGARRTTPRLVTEKHSARQQCLADGKALTSTPVLVKPARMTQETKYAQRSWEQPRRLVPNTHPSCSTRFRVIAPAARRCQRRALRSGTWWCNSPSTSWALRCARSPL